MFQIFKLINKAKDLQQEECIICFTSAEHKSLQKKRYYGEENNSPEII